MKLRIIRDDCASSPRDWDNLGTMACWHRRYTLGDEQPSYQPDEFEEGLPEGTIIVPLFMYDHSGITIQTRPFSCSWDSGQLGIAYVTPDRVKEEGITPEEARKVLEGEIKLYDQFVRGSVWGFVIEKECGECGQTTETEESCFGFIGDELEETGIKDHLGSEMWELLEAAWEVRA